MGATSLGYVRRRWFEVFFGVHQLYVLFMLFLFWHVGQKSGHVFMLPGMFLFIFDRLQRAFQSWSYAGVIATKTMPDGSFQVRITERCFGKSWMRAFTLFQLSVASSNF
jgi:ferric-chelate reductase